MPALGETIDLQSNGDFAGSLDAGLEFIRAFPAWTVPMYALAVAPTALLMLPIIGDIAVHRPSDGSAYCWLLLPAMIWRWCILGLIQLRARWAITGKMDSDVFKRRLFPLIILRLIFAVWVIWGGWLMLVPALPALIFGAFVAPSLLDAPSMGLKQVLRPLVIGLKSASTWRQLIAALLTGVAVYIGIIESLNLLADTILPTFAGISDLRLQLLLRSSALELGVLLVIWMGFDLLWHVSAVIQFYFMQSRHSGADIQFRLNGMREKAA